MRLLSCSFVTYSFASSFSLILCVYFYVLSRSFMFPDLGEMALCRRRHMGPNSTFPLVTRAICIMDVPYVGCMSPSLVEGPTTVGTLVCGASFWPSWLLRPASCSGCWPTGRWNQVLAWLAAWLMGPWGWCQPTGGLGWVPGWFALSPRQ